MNERGLNGRVVPRPFLKWAGGKGQLLEELMARVEAAKPFGRYHEPFLGGGALFFEMVRRGELSRKALLSDNNPNLMDAYNGLKEDVEGVISLLKKHRVRHSEEYYYKVRGQVPKKTTERAARIIYLNKTCYNGLYRENQSGQFNVPFGRYKKPAICDEANLRAVAVALKDAVVETRHFVTVLDVAGKGDLVYFDPPYHPLSRTSSFTGYEKTGFGEDSQRLLADVFRKLDGLGVKVLLSNSMTPLIQKLYAGFDLDTVYAARFVNSRADRRGRIREALVRNFKL
jgi:DNA adenine methylase